MGNSQAFWCHPFLLDKIINYALVSSKLVATINSVVLTQTTASRCLSFQSVIQKLISMLSFKISVVFFVNGVLISNRSHPGITDLSLLFWLIISRHGCPHHFNLSICYCFPCLFSGWGGCCRLSILTL